MGPSLSPKHTNTTPDTNLGAVVAERDAARDGTLIQRQLILLIPLKLTRSSLPSRLPVAVHRNTRLANRATDDALDRSCTHPHDDQPAATGYDAN